VSTARQRVVSLVPSATESLRFWGRDPIACTRFCEQDDLVHVGGTKDPDIQAIIDLRPDLVVLEREENRLPDHDELVAAGLDVEVLHITSLADVDPEMARLASRVDAAWVPFELGPPIAQRCVAFVPIWKRPWMTFNESTYAASLLAHLGVESLAAGHEPTYPELSEDELSCAAPVAVLAPSEPYPFAERHRVELEQFGPVTFIDGQDLFWWGTRSSDAVSRLREALVHLG
jgi:ABC-type Fe3+-hydroxamate transport system substrate-binding protein